MNVLHLNQSDVIGGASIAAYRLHQGLLSQKVDSRLLVGHAGFDSDRIAIMKRHYRLENRLSFINNHLGLNYLNTLGSFEICKHKFYKNADLLNFHNLHTGYFNYLAIPSLTKDKPAIMTLHDMWSFTGHCAYSFDCGRWQTGCGRCPYPETYPAVQRDNTHLEWKIKAWIYQHSNLDVVTLSRWLTNQVKKSMLTHFPIHYIPNGIDTEAYQPLEQGMCRSILGITKKKVLMYSAANLNDSRKGMDLLIAALARLDKTLRTELLLLTFGSSRQDLAKLLDIEMLNLGYLESDRLKAIAYSAADLFVLPTRADNLPLVLQESMACGTPMVAFNVGGVPDLVRPGLTGYLAAPESVEDLSIGILQLLEDNNLRNQFGQNCRQIIIDEYTLELQVKRYIDLYKDVLSR